MSLLPPSLYISPCKHPSCRVGKEKGAACAAIVQLQIDRTAGVTAWEEDVSVAESLIPLCAEPEALQLIIDIFDHGHDGLTGDELDPLPPDPPDFQGWE